MSGPAPSFTDILGDHIDLYLDIKEKFDCDFVGTTVINCAARAHTIITLSKDFNNAETILAHETLRLARRALVLLKNQADRQLAEIIIKMLSAEETLDDLSNIPIKNTGQRALESQRSATNASALSKRPRRQVRIEAFQREVRERPSAGPKVWSATLAPLHFGGLEIKHVENAKRFYSRHRVQIEAALVEDTPAECPPILYSE